MMKAKEQTHSVKILIPAVVLFLAGPAAAPFILLGGDSHLFLRYCLYFFLFALLSRPLSKKLFPESPDGGWLYGMLGGLLLPALLIWLLASGGLPVFTSLGLRLALLLSALLMLLPSLKRGKKGLAELSFSVPELGLCLGESGLFFLLFLFGTFMRSLKPEVMGLEKFMDYGFMMSMWRNPALPAQDMWLAGHRINYYYFGQYLFTALAKLCRTEPAYSYNLSMAASFALSFSLGFALVRDLLFDLGERHAAPVRKAVSHLGGLLAAALLTLAGNSHAFFYAPGRGGRSFLKFLERSGVEVGNTEGFYFSDSTRFIGYNPDVPDKTIHEFPFYSYIVADLHAHMINLSLVLLLLALLYNLYRSLRRSFNKAESLAPSPAEKPPRFSRAGLRPHIPRELLTGQFWAAGIIMGMMSMANYWDYVIYLVVSFLLLTAAFGADPESEDLGRLKGFLLLLLQLLITFLIYLKVSSPWPQLLLFTVNAVLNSLLCFYFPHALNRAGRGLSWLFVLAQFTSLSFNIGFEPMSKALVLTTSHSSFFQLFALWFFHVFCAVIFLICFFVFNLPEMKKHLLKTPLSMLLSCRTELLFFLGLACCGIGLIAAPELVYVRDIYEGSFSRANTMFKFTYQAFTLLSLSAGFTAGALLLKFLPKKRPSCEGDLQYKAVADETPTAESDAAEFDLPEHIKKAERSPYTRPRWPVLLPLLLLLISLIIPFSYTPEIKTWYGDLSLSRRQGLEATAYYGRQSYEDDQRNLLPLYDRYQLIKWFNENVQGQPHILESFGLSYTEYCAVSAYTGLPTVLGWQTHEWLWRTSAEEKNAYVSLVAPLQEEIMQFYTAAYPETQAAFIRQHDISYIVVGELERARFKEIDEEALTKLGEIVFRSGKDYIIQVK